MFILRKMSGKFIQLGIRCRMKLQVGVCQLLQRDGLRQQLYSTGASVQNEILPRPSLAVDKVYEQKIVDLVDHISKLTLREVADLNELLKTTLNIEDVAILDRSSAIAAEPKSNDEETLVPEKEEFIVKLISFTPADKIKLIKALKIIKPTLNLVQAKKFVESTPQILSEDIPKVEAEQIKKTLEEAGGKVEIV